MPDDKDKNKNIDDFLFSDEPFPDSDEELREEMGDLLPDNDLQNYNVPLAQNQDENEEAEEEKNEEVEEEKNEEVEEVQENKNIDDFLFSDEPFSDSKSEIPQEIQDSAVEKNEIQESFDEVPIERTEQNAIDMVTVRPVKFKEFEPTEPNRSIKRNLDILQDISMHVSVELGRTKSSIKSVMDMDVGTIVELDKVAGEQVEIYVNQQLVAKGEVIVIEDKFGVRVTATNIAKPEE